MSALRVGHGVYVDPWTHMEITVPEPLPTTEPSPVIRRRATPEELARLDCPDSPPRIIDSIGLIPRPIRGRLTDAERIARTLRAAAVRGAEATARRQPGRPQRHADDVVLAAVLAHRGNRSAAGRALGVSEQWLHRRIAALRADGKLPLEVAAVLAGRKGGMR